MRAPHPPVLIDRTALSARRPPPLPARVVAAEKHKGFAFVQYDEKEDAADAIDNMHNAELFGRVLRVNLSKPDAHRGGHRPVWESQADSFFAKGAGAEEGEGEGDAAAGGGS